MKFSTNTSVKQRRRRQFVTYTEPSLNSFDCFSRSTAPVKAGLFDLHFRQIARHQRNMFPANHLRDPIGI